MKKISLKDVKNSLSRDEMRMISGGSSSCGHSCSSSWGCGQNNCGYCASKWGGRYCE